MIDIELTHALVLYSGILAVIALSVWAYTEFSTRRVHRVLEQQYLWRCTFCGYTYLDDSGQELSQCPQCESFNSVSDENARFVQSSAIERWEKEPKEAEEPRGKGSRRKRPHQRRRGPRKRS